MLLRMGLAYLLSFQSPSLAGSAVPSSFRELLSCCPTTTPCTPCAAEETGLYVEKLDCEPKSDSRPGLFVDQVLLPQATCVSVR